MSVTVRSFVLFESKCIECYSDDANIPEHGMCCDPEDELEDQSTLADSGSKSCSNSCDVMVALCPVMVEFGGQTTNSVLNSTQCVVDGRIYECIAEGYLGFNFTADKVFQYNAIGNIGLANVGLVNPFIYNITESWEESDWNNSIYPTL